jgi:hypothetical protein
MTSARQDNGPRQDNGGPIARRIQLGAHLRRLRRAADVTRDAAGWHIRGSESKISRMELGRVPLKERDVADLLTLYGVDDHERASLLVLAQQANVPGWWQQYADIVPARVLAYLGLEDAACRIRTYELHSVPALLQTPGYARVVLRDSHADATEAELDRLVRMRLTRQDVLRRPNPPVLWAVLDEAVLRRPFGGPEVMRDQLLALIAASHLPHVRLQIVPFAHAAPTMAGFPFTILRFAEPDLSDVVHLEQLTGAQHLDKPHEVEHYSVVMERSCAIAASPERTIKIFEGMLNELTTANT